MAEKFIINGFCILIMLILLLSVAFQKSKNDKTNFRFSILVCMVMGFLTFNLLTDICEGKPELRVLSYIVNFIAFIFIDCAIIAFSYYLSTLMRKVSKKWAKVLNPGVFFTYIRVIVIIVLFATDNLFFIDNNGCYQDRPLSIIPYIMSGVIMIMLIVVVFNNRKYFTLKQTVVIMLYLLLPLPCVIIEMITEIYSLTVVSLTLSVLLIYVMVQSSIIESGRVRESVLEELSSTDLLTSLNNRRAYYNFISNITSKQNIGVMFFDINGLKYTNDNFGHFEGDKLIVAFSKLLTDNFYFNNVFRISGDEFVVMLPDISNNEFSQKAENFKQIISENNSIAACGSAYGTGDNIEQLVSDAESLMYENKRYQHSNGLSANVRNS